MPIRTRRGSHHKFFARIAPHQASCEAPAGYRLKAERGFSNGNYSTGHPFVFSELVFMSGKVLECADVAARNRTNSGRA